MPLREWDGASWIESVPRIHDGAAWSDANDEYRVWDGAEWQLIYPDPADAGDLLPVEDLAVTAGPDHHSVTVGWTNPTQPTVTPTHIALRIPEISTTWQLTELPYTEYTHAALQPSTEYQVQVRLEEWVLGVRNDYSPTESVFFATTVAPVGVPAEDPGGDGIGDTIIPIGITTDTPTAPSTVDGCWWEWKIEILSQADAYTWIATGITGTAAGDADDISYDFALLDPTRVYKLCIRQACDTTSDGSADTWEAWICGDPFVGTADWGAVCGGIADSTTVTDLTAVDDAVYRFPKVCTLDDGQRVGLIEAVSGVEIGKGPDFQAYYNSFFADEWGAMADSDGGFTMIAPIVALETLFVTAQDSSHVWRFEFPDSYSLVNGAVTTLASMGGACIVRLTESATGWTPSIEIYGENGLITLTGSEVTVLDGQIHTIALTWDDDGDKLLYVNGTLEDTDASTDTYGTFTASSHYVTAQVGYGVTLQQIGWDRVLTPTEVLLFTTSEVVELSDDFSWGTTGTTMGSQADWNEATGRMKRAVGESITHDGSTSDSTAVHATALTLGSNFVRVDNAVYGVKIRLRNYYELGIHYYGSGSGDWYWALRRNTTNLDTGGQSPGKGSPAKLYLECVVEGANVRLKGYINDVLRFEEVDVSPLTDDGAVGINHNGRGAGDIPGFDNFEAGRLI